MDKMVFPEAIHSYSRCSMHAWWAINEAFGLSKVYAQSC